MDHFDLLSNDCVDHLVAFVKPEDRFALSRTCRRFAERLVAVFGRSRVSEITFVVSVKRLQWGMASAGYRLTAQTSMFAAARGCVDVLDALHTLRCTFDANACRVAASFNRLEAMQWIWQNKTADPRSCAIAAARHGHIEALEWIGRNAPYPCVFNKVVFAAAASCANNLAVLEWLHDGRCPWNSTAVTSAITFGRLDALIWLLQKDAPRYHKFDMMSRAISLGHLDIVKWIDVNEVTFIKPALLCSFATQRRDNIEVLAWMRGEGYDWGEFVVRNAASSNCQKALEWLRANGCPQDFEKHACKAAANEGHLELLKWLVVQGYPVPRGDALANLAASHGHLHLLEWLWEENLSEFTTVTAHRALHSRDAPTIAWLFDRGCAAENPYEDMGMERGWNIPRFDYWDTIEAMSNVEMYVV